MKFSVCSVFLLLLSVCAANTAFADNAGLQDARAVGVLNSMAGYTSKLDQFVVTGEVTADARLDAGLMVSNPSSLVLKIDRPGSLYLSNFDGVNSKNIYLNDGRLTVFGTEKNYYAHASVPKDIEQGMLFAMEEFDLDTPLGELFFAETAIKLLLDGTEVIYLTDKSRIQGVDCHHIAVRGVDVDVQLWIEEGSKPVPRKMMMTMKWENGSPRYSAVLAWETESKFDSDVFNFKPPEGAMQIKFTGSE